MARIFITPREIDFISDLTKEITKDVRDQKIYYYRIREELTNVHDVYEEAPEKVFDPPIEVHRIVEKDGLIIRRDTKPLLKKEEKIVP